MRNLRIGLDFDGVIANTPEMRSRAAKELLNRDVPANCMLNKEYIVEHGYIPLEEYNEMQDVLYATDSPWNDTLEPMTGAKEGIKQLLSQGHDILCITSRTSSAVILAREWMKKQNIPLHVSGLDGHSGKLHVAQKHNREVYIDDHPRYLEPMIGHVPHLFLYSWMYNSDMKIHEGIARVSSWKAFLDEIQYLSSQ